MANNTLFLETTAIIDHCFAAATGRIDRILEQHEKKLSAQYVRMEIKRGFLQYLVLLHNKLTTYTSYHEVADSIYRLSATPSRNRLSSILKVMAEFFKDVEKEKIDNLDEYLRREMASYTRILIRRLWNSLERLAEDLLNPMDCYLDIAPPRQAGTVLHNDGSQCNKSEIECKIKEFFEAHRKDFEAILKALRALPNPDFETKKRIKSLKEILRLLPYGSRKFSNKEHNFKHCWSCGDAILAVLSPAKSTILTSNLKHFQPICNIIDRKVISYRE